MPIAEPTRIEVDGADLAKRPALSEVPEGWTYAADTGCLTLKLQFGKAPRQVRSHQGGADGSRRGPEVERQRQRGGRRRGRVDPSVSADLNEVDDRRGSIRGRRGFGNQFQGQRATHWDVFKLKNDGLVSAFRQLRDIAVLPDDVALQLHVEDALTGASPAGARKPRRMSYTPLGCPASASMSGIWQRS